MTESTTTTVNKIYSNEYESKIKLGSYIGKILAKCSKYVNDSSYVYKMSKDVPNYKNDYNNEGWLVVMQKLQETKTNEERKGIVNSSCAKFRANKLKVVEIFKMSNPEINKEYVINAYGDVNLTYRVKQIVGPNYYDDDIENVCSCGIHYFKTPLRVIYYGGVPVDFTGEWFYFSDDGFKEKVENLVNGKLSGKTTEFYKNGTIYREWHYENGERSGNFTRWHENGKKEWEGNYTNDKKTGVWFKWNNNGKLFRETNYLNGEKMGKQITYDIDGNKIYEYEYANGIQSGVCIQYFSNGDKNIEGQCLRGMKVGEWTIWEMNGSKKIVNYGDGLSLGKTKYKYIGYILAVLPFAILAICSHAKTFRK